MYRNSIVSIAFLSILVAACGESRRPETTETAVRDEAVFHECTPASEMVVAQSSADGAEFGAERRALIGKFWLPLGVGEKIAVTGWVCNAPGRCESDDTCQSSVRYDPLDCSSAPVLWSEDGHVVVSADMEDDDRDDELRDGAVRAGYVTCIRVDQVMAPIRV